MNKATLIYGVIPNEAEIAAYFDSPERNGRYVIHTDVYTTSHLIFGIPVIAVDEGGVADVANLGIPNTDGLIDFYDRIGMTDAEPHWILTNIVL